MSAQAEPDSDGLLTIDELSSVVGMTVRTTRYYASLGLIPAPIRRGRVAYYDETHRARLEMVRALQDHGFTLQAIERYMATLPGDASVEDLALQRAMLTSWSPHPPETLTRRQLEKKAARKLSERDIDLLVELGTLERADQGFVAMPNLEVGRRAARPRHPRGQHGCRGRRDPPAHGVAGGGADRHPAHAGARALPARAALARGRREAGAHDVPACGSSRSRPW